MATLDNPITPQNIVDRFADFVRDTANAGIVWGTDAEPFEEFDETLFGGSTSGRGLGINAATLSLQTGEIIIADIIHDQLVNETNEFTRIKKINAKLNVTGGGGNTGTRPTAGVVIDQTEVAHMKSTYVSAIPVIPEGSRPNAGETIDASDLEAFFDRLKLEYNSKRNDTTVIQVDVCHASCHSSCHGSRGRR